MSVLKNTRHERFAQAVFEGKAGRDAYHQAGYSANDAAAETNASRLLRNAQVAARVAELAAAAADETVMSAREVLQELTKLGRTNMQDYMTVSADGLPRLDWSRLSREQGAALAEVTVDQVAQPAGDGDEALPPVNKVKFKLHSKVSALDLLGKHHALYTEKVVVIDGIADRLTAALTRTGDRSPHGQVRPDRDPPRARRKGRAARKGRRAGAG